jgi:hypothetical protein
VNGKDARESNFIVTKRTRTGEARGATPFDDRSAVTIEMNRKSAYDEV